MVKHITTIEEFKKEVLNSKRPVIVDFWAEWCGPCRMLGPIFESLAKERKDVKFVKVDVDEGGDIAAEYSVMSIPTIIIFKGGQAVDQKLGALPKDMLNDFINKNL